MQVSLCGSFIELTEPPSSSSSEQDPLCEVPPKASAQQLESHMLLCVVLYVVLSVVLCDAEGWATTVCACVCVLATVCWEGKVLQARCEARWCVAAGYDGCAAAAVRG